jgi:hypothetical protein
MSTVPTFRTWVVGELVTASYMNTNIRDAGNFLTAMPVFQGRQTVAQSLATNTGVAINLDTEDIDTDGGHSTVTNTSRYVGQTPGWYRLAGGGSCAANATGARLSWASKNGTVIPGSATAGIPNAGNAMELACKTLFVNLNGTTDYVEVDFFQSSGGALNTVVAGNEAQPLLNVQWVRV